LDTNREVVAPVAEQWGRSTEERGGDGCSGMSSSEASATPASLCSTPETPATPPHSILHLPGARSQQWPIFPKAVVSTAAVAAPWQLSIREGTTRNGGSGTLGGDTSSCSGTGGDTWSSAVVNMTPSFLPVYNGAPGVVDMTIPSMAWTNGPRRSARRTWPPPNFPVPGPPRAKRVTWPRPEWDQEAVRKMDEAIRLVALGVWDRAQHLVPTATGRDEDDASGCRGATHNSSAIPDPGTGPESAAAAVKGIDATGIDELPLAQLRLATDHKEPA